MDGRTQQDSTYRYGFNGFEKDNEIYGAGRSYTAEFWQYDSRLGRRWNVDPLASHPNQIGMSPYSAFWNNPLRFTDPDGRCPECEENVKDPTDGQRYMSTGGAGYTFGNGAWTRQGGTLNEIIVSAEKPSILEMGYYRGTAAAQDAWNSPIARSHIPDKISLSFSSSVTAFAGTNTDFSLNWITRGHDSQFMPYAVLTVGGQGGPQVSGDALININVGYYATTDMRNLQSGEARDGLLGWSIYGSVDAGLGIGGSVTGSVGFQDSPFVSRPTWLSGGVGAGASIGGGATGGVGYSWPIVPKQFKKQDP